MFLKQLFNIYLISSLLHNKVWNVDVLVNLIPKEVIKFYDLLPRT